MPYPVDSVDHSDVRGLVKKDLLQGPKVLTLVRTTGWGFQGVSGPAEKLPQ